MSIELVNAIRKLGWPDSKGEWQYGNAAILCYLSQRTKARKFVEQFKEIPLDELISRYS